MIVKSGLNMRICSFVLALSAVTAFAASVPLPRPVPSIIRGPYLQCATTNTVVVRWRTDTMGPSIVRYGLSPTNLNRRASSAGQLTEHVVLLTNLVADTKYYYALGTNDVPIVGLISNNTLFVRTTNGSLAVSEPDRTLLLRITNRTFELKPRGKGFIVTAPQGSTNFSEPVLILTTTNYSLMVSNYRGRIEVATTNMMRVVREEDGKNGKQAKKNRGIREFVIGTTNTMFIGGVDAPFFYTPPPVADQRPMRIWVVGDPGTRRPPQYHVRDGFLKFNGGKRIDVWLLLGDNAYTAGTDVEYQGSIFQAYQSLLRNWVLWPSLGNHDAGSADSPTQSGVYYDIFTLPTQAQAGGVMSGTEAYYSFDYGNVHFIAIDSANSSLTTNGMMYQWLKRDLEANKQDWCIAFCHHPPYTKGSHDSDRERDSGGIMQNMRGVIVPLLEDGGVDVLLTGHSHAYERSFLLDSHYSRSTTMEEEKTVKSDSDGRGDSWGAYHKPSRGPAAHEGALYIVAGSSGQVSGGSLLHPTMYAGLNIHGSLVLDVHGSKMEGLFVDTNGLVRDYFTFTKGSGLARAKEVVEPDELMEFGSRKIPGRLKSLLLNGAALVTATNARPSDEELLLELYKDTNLSNKTALTWALAWIGDADAVVRLMGTITNKLAEKNISAAEEDLRLETIEALGMLSARYEAPFTLLKRGLDPEYWENREYWNSPRGSQGYRGLTLASIRALGISGRPEARLALMDLRKKQERDKETGPWADRMSSAIDQALVDCEQFQKLGPTKFQRSLLLAPKSFTQTSAK